MPTYCDEHYFLLRLREVELAAIEPTEMIVLLLVKCCGFGFYVLI